MSVGQSDGGDRLEGEGGAGRAEERDQRAGHSPPPPSRTLCLARRSRAASASSWGGGGGTRRRSARVGLPSLPRLPLPPLAPTGSSTDASSALMELIEAPGVGANRWRPCTEWGGERPCRWPTHSGAALWPRPPTPPSSWPAWATPSRPAGRRCSRSSSGWSTQRWAIGGRRCGGAGGGRAACACCMTREHSIETAATDRAPPSVQIRHHAPADRAALTAPLDDKAWRAALASYLSALNYPEPAPAPGDVSGEAAVADWLLGRAVALAAADAGAARLAPAVAAAVEAGAAVLDAPETTTAPPFADLGAPATADAVAALADAVGAPPGPLPARLAATEALLTDRLLPAAALTGAGGGAAPDAALLAAAPSASPPATPPPTARPSPCAGSTCGTWRRCRRGWMQRSRACRR